VNNSIGRVTSILCIPYGYTVSLWSAGVLAVTRLGLPSTLEVMLFVVGSVTAFVGLAGVGLDHLEAEVPMRVPSLVVVNLFPVLAVLTVVVFPLALFGRSAGYFLSSFLVTGSYVLCIALMVRAVRAWRARAGSEG
jgi:hypothetical protein